MNLGLVVRRKKRSELAQRAHKVMVMCRGLWLRFIRRSSRVESSLVHSLVSGQSQAVHFQAIHYMKE